MPAVDFDLLVRTPSSARWAIMLGGVEAGSVDLHVEGERTRATVVVRADVDDESVGAIIEEFDEHKIPPELRRDVQFTVWRGDPLGTFAPAE